MRNVFFAVLLANLLYFGWAEWIDVPPPPPQSAIAGLPHLTLVSELPPAQRVALAKKIADQKRAAECVSVGPFNDPELAAQAAALLRSKSFTLQQRVAVDPAARRFWVYLDGFTSDASEMRTLHRLEQSGIDDAEAMPADAGGRRVSLGLYTDRDRAQNRAKVVRTLGFRPAVSERLLPGDVYWLDVTPATGTTAVAQQDVSDLPPGGTGASISLQPCPTAPAPTAPSSQPQSSAGSSATPPTRAPKARAPALAPRTRSSASASISKATLPICKPGVPAPCVVVKETSRPSVL